MICFKWFKKIVYNINHSNVEKTILLRKNLKQIVQLLLLDVFISSEFILIVLFHELYNNCFFLFENFLSKFEQKQLLNENKFKLWIVFDVNHKKFSAVDRLEIKYCREILKMLIKTSIDDWIMSVAMKTTLRNVYSVDYAMSHIMHFDIFAIQWCKKLIYYNFSSKHWIIFAIKNFIEFRNHQMIRFDLLFVHELNFVRRLFVNVFNVQNINYKNEMLNFFFWKFDAYSDWNIIELSTIHVKKFYMFSTNKKTKMNYVKIKKLFLMNWVFQYLW